MKTLTATAISPDDFLDGARTIPQGDIRTCSWLSDWVPSTEFLQWAKRGLDEGDVYGLSNAIVYAKRAATSRIDTLLGYNHLAPFARGNYPTKIAGLRDVGLSIPDVVQELVIDPRNVLEHAYRFPDPTVAHHSVGVAELFVRATEPEYERASIIAVAWNAMGSDSMSPKGRQIAFRGFGERPMLFIDVFEEPRVAKIVDPGNGEIRSAELSRFSKNQSLALAGILRSNYKSNRLSRMGADQAYYREMKRQGGF